MATPLDMPIRRPVAPTSAVVYRTWTGKAPAAPVPSLLWDEDYCGVCRRSTDHFAEHDDLVLAGLATYEGGNVVRTDQWDDDIAAAVCESTVLAYALGMSA